MRGVFLLNMKTFFSLSFALLALLLLTARTQAASATTVSAAVAVESLELTRARANLLDAYTRGGHDDDKNVKELKAEVARLEYIAANNPSRSETPAPLFSVDFPGGSVATLMALIEKSGSAGLNIIGEKTDLALDLPPLSVRNTDASSFASALDSILRPRGYILESSRRPSAPNQAPVYVLRKLNAYEVPNRNSSSLFQAFQLASFLDTHSVDDIVNAIRTAWELDPSHNRDAMHLKFHPPTGILFVSCPPEGVSLVQNVLSELRRLQPPAPKPAAAPKAGPTPAAETR